VYPARPGQDWALLSVETDMIYELRVYSCLPGRLPALLKRFESETLKIWEKHGIKQAGFWTVLIGDGNHDLYYLLAWDSMAEREKKWTTFQADPAWIAARSASERDGPILANVKSMLLQPTAFSAVK
jgi:NIPSNAP